MQEFFMIVFGGVWPWLGFTIVVLGGLEIITKAIIAILYSSHEHGDG